MNTKVIYAVGAGIIIIGLIFYFLFNSGFLGQTSNNGDLSTPLVNTTEGNATGSNPLPPQSTENLQMTPQQLNNQNLSIGIDSVKIVPVNNETRLEVAFDAYNPNKGAAILETVTYNVYVDGVRLSSGDLGTRTEGFVDSLESVYTIIGNQTIVLRDREPLTEDGLKFFDSQGNWIGGSSNATQFDVNGTYFFTLNRGSESQARENSFNFQYPITP
jgi:hypothetical protein